MVKVQKANPESVGQKVLKKTFVKKKNFSKELNGKSFKNVVKNMDLENADMYEIFNEIQNVVKKTPSMKKTILAEMQGIINEAKLKNKQIEAELRQGKIKNMSDRKNNEVEKGEKKNPFKRKYKPRFDVEVKKESSLDAEGKKKNIFVPKNEQKNGDIENFEKNAFGRKIMKKTFTEKFENENCSHNLVTENEYMMNKKKKFESYIYQQVNFDEEKFKQIVSSDNIRKVVTTLKILFAKEISEKNILIRGDYKYILSVSTYKPNRNILELNLKHSLVDIKRHNIVMIVSNIKDGEMVNNETIVQYYEGILEEFDIDYIKIVPFNLLGYECSTDKSKIQFVKTYDYFLCDKRILPKVISFCGSHARRARANIYPVNLCIGQIYKINIEKALCQISCKHFNKHHTFFFPVGDQHFTINKLVENIEEVIKQLRRYSLLNGYANIRSIYFRTGIQGTSGVPLFVNLSNAKIRQNEEQLKESDECIENGSEFEPLSKKKVKKNDKMAKNDTHEDENGYGNENINQEESEDDSDNTHQDDSVNSIQVESEDDSDDNQEESEGDSDNIDQEESADDSDDIDQEENEDDSDNMEQESENDMEDTNRDSEDDSDNNNQEESEGDDSDSQSKEEIEDDRDVSDTE